MTEPSKHYDEHVSAIRGALRELERLTEKATALIDCARAALAELR